MKENKTKPTVSSVTAFLHTVEDKPSRDDCFTLIEIMRAASNSEPVMWGSAIVGFGSHHYVYESGREGDTVVLGFSPRKGKIAIYLLGGLTPLESELPALGKYKTGKGCLYIKSLGDVNRETLQKIFTKVFEASKHRSNPTA